MKLPKLFQPDELKILWPFYLERFVTHLIYFAPAFWIIQFQQTLSLTQIGILFSLLAFSGFFFEIPTGAIADIYGRKFSVLLGYFLAGIFIIPIYFVKDFYILMILFTFWGISTTFISGAKEAWVVDKLKANKRGKLTREFFLKDHSLIYLGLFLSGFLGAWIVAEMGLNIIWIFAAISYIATGVMLLFVSEERITKENKHTLRELFKQARISVKYSLKHHVLLFLLSAGFFIMLREAFGGDIVWQPFLKSLGFPVYAFGFLFSAMTLLGAVSPFFSKLILKLFKGEKQYLTYFILITMILDFLVLLAGNLILGLILMVLIYFSVDLQFPISSNYFQSWVPSKIRATVTSFQSMIISLAYAISYFSAGFVADKIGPQYTIAMGALFLIPAFILFLMIKEKK